ncbi:MBL fold metallo-hydrolase [Gelidibacter gilvus]|uniref:MBL fold metallo-hydrolase n=1 Tax=Gelidibacter gilvus TaxID=59602 RepID=A0A4Q0XD66_9FLAO|nr:MBL fold metallo-hydrolase [Gelidibacter gilvus]RXJ45882.1 MBL fold metallo-hydrolase [Gelidibacter gilvus]
MKHASLITSLFIVLLFNCKNSTEKVVEMASESANELYETTKPEEIKIIPIEHATMILAHKDQVVYVDPVGGLEAFSGQEKPDYILITDIHGDHLDLSTLERMVLDSTTLIVPKAVKEKLPELKAKEIIVMNNGDIKDFGIFSIEAIPMYNLRPEALKYHEKGRGNGYVLTWNDQRIYISGDTEDIPEMRNLKNIDIAFVCMNLPYTMTVESAASAVLEFQPKKVYPYHYRGTDGMSDIAKFKSIINKDHPNIEVMQLNWYK